MEIIVHPGQPLAGTIRLPGDKSISHRAALFAALATGVSRVENFLVAGVTTRMLDALVRMGVDWQLNESLPTEDSGQPGLPVLVVKSPGLAALHERLAAQEVAPVMDCGNSATTLRLLAGAVAAGRFAAVLDGSPGLRRRPMDRIVAPLQQMGVPIRAVEGKFAPLVIEPASSHPYQALHYTLPVASAQVKSCLLLAGLAADGVTTLLEPGPSRDHTERMLRSMGAQVFSRQVGSQVEVSISPLGGKALSPLALPCPADISAAAFLIVAALITPGSEIMLPGVGLNPTRTGLLDTLLEMGADITILNQQEQAGEPLGDLLVRHSLLRGATVQGERVVRMIDEFPVFAVAAACADGPTLVADAEELRYKESDRIAVLVEQLQRAGIHIEPRPDGFFLPGNTPPQGGEAMAQGDHRIAMSLCVAGLAAQRPITVHNAEIIGESFPNFVQVLARLGAEIHQAGEAG